jgi:hypothetical protein
MAKDPMALLEQMAQNDPKISNILNVLKQSGGDPQKAVYALMNNESFNLDALKKMYYGS